MNILTSNISAYYSIYYFRKQLCGTGETIQSYHHQTYHRPQVIQKHLSNDDDIDVGKVGDEVIELESEYIENHYQLKFEFGYIGRGQDCERGS